MLLTLKGLVSDYQITYTSLALKLHDGPESHEVVMQFNKEDEALKFVNHVGIGEYLELDLDLKFRCREPDINEHFKVLKYCPEVAYVVRDVRIGKGT